MLRWRQFFRGTFRVIASGVWVYAELFVAAALLLATAPVQNAFRPWLMNRLADQLGVDVQASYINVGLPDHLVLHDVRLCDRADLEMITVRRLGIGLISFAAWDFLSGAKTRHVRVRSVHLTDVMLNLYHRTKDGRLNLDVVFEGEEPPPPDTSAPSDKLTLFSASDIQLRNMRFRFVDSVETAAELRPTPGHINFANLALHEVTLDGSFEWLGAGHYRVGVDHFSFHEVHANRRIRHVEAVFEADQHWPLLSELPDDDADSVSFIHLKDLRIRDGRTDLQADFRFRNEEYRSLFKSNAPKRYTFEVRPSTVDFATVNIFTPEDLPVVGVAKLQATIVGDPNRLRCRDFRADYGQHTHVEADVRLQDYRMGDSLFLQARLKGACTEGNELHRLLPTSDLPDELRNLGKVCVTGSYLGFTRDFVADATFDSDLGRVVTDLNFKRPKGKPVFYEGRLVTDRFNLDRLLGTSVSQSLNFDGRLYGSGLTFEEADAKFDFTSSGSMLRGYLVDSISGKVEVANREVKGLIEAHDAQGSFEGRVDVDLSQGRPSYFFIGDLRRLDLRHYGLYPDSVLLSTIFNVNLAGDSLDNLSGVVRCFEIDLRDVPRRRDYELKDLVISSRLNTAQSKSVQVTSRLGTLALQGDFSYKEAIDKLTELGLESELFFRNEIDSIGLYYMNKFPPTRPLNFSMQAQVRELNPLLDFLRSPLRIASGTVLQARFGFADREQGHLTVAADSLAWGSTRLIGVGFKADLDKPAMENQLGGQGQLTAKTLFIGSGARFDEVKAIPFIRNRQLDFQLGLSQDSLRKRLLLAGTVGLLPNGFIARINADSSHIELNDSRWTFDSDNRIEYQPGRLRIDHVRLSSGNQSIGIEADAGKGTPDVLYATIRNVELQRLAEILLPEAAVAGTVNGTFTIRQPLAEPRYQVEGTVRRFQFDKLTYGDVYLRSRLSDFSQRMFITSNLVYRGDTLIGLRGYYDPEHATSPLNFVLATHNLPVKLLEPFVKETLYDLRGKLQVQALQVRGKLAAPTISGSAALDSVSFGVRYFKSTFSLEGTMDLNQRVITMRDMRLRDARGNPALVEGTIRHYGFANPDFDLRLRDLRNFLIMNTEAEDNELFYGRSVIRRGSAEVKGKFGDLFINANLTTGVGSRIAIPVSFYRKQARLPYVRFKGTEGQDFTGIGQLDVLGMTLNLEIETTPDAECQVVFDERSGEVIRGRGAGTLTMIITRLGDFSMYGTYEVQQGSYLFNLRNAIKKRFEVDRGGTITWSGDPYDAQMNVSAIYRVNASLRSLDTTIQSSQLIPVDVFLRLRGALFRPEVSFDIQFPNSGIESNLALSSLQRTITNDPQALNNQVISLLAFNRFAPPGNFFGAGGAAGGVASSATELLSNQINTLLGQAFDEKVGVNVSTNQFNDFNLGLRAQLFNNRLTIERNGVLVSQTNRNMTLGNLSIRYRLLPSERRLQTNPNPLTLSLEMFNRENFGFGNQLVSTSRGVGAFIRKEFDTFGELLPLSTAKPDTAKVIAVDSAALRRLRVLPDSVRRDSIRRDTSAIPERFRFRPRPTP